MPTLKEETRDTYEALKEARDAARSKLPVFTIQSFDGCVDDQGTYNGQGFISSCMEFQYAGELRSGQLEGQGKVAWANGYRVEGTFAEGIPNGKGTIHWPNGDTYEGDLVNGVRHGFGKLTSHNGTAVYEGSWFRSRRHGKGTQKYTDGSVYSGDWEHDMREGTGIITYANQDCYEGDWHQNQRHGLGCMGWKQGTPNYVEMYDGSWVSGVPHGKGVSTYVRPLDSVLRDDPNVTPKSFAPLTTCVLNVYRGNFVSGMRHGFGTFYYADGSAYEGEWEKNKKHGHGKFVNYNGTCFHGAFQNDQSMNPDLTIPSFPLRPDVVPELNIDDICGVPDGSTEHLRRTTNSLLLRFNTPLRAMFSDYANLQEDVAFAFTPEHWWKHRLPSRIAIPQFLRFLSDKHILSGLVSIGTVIQCIARVIELEFQGQQEPTAQQKCAHLTAKIYRLQGSLNYRQFAETVVRLSPAVCVGMEFYGLGGKFNYLVTEKLIPNNFTEPLCKYSREHLDKVRPYLPQLEAKFNGLVDLYLNQRSRVLQVRDFLRFIHVLLDRQECNNRYAEAIALMFPSFLPAPHSTTLPPGYNKPYGKLNVSMFYHGCGPNMEWLIAGVAVSQVLTIVDFVEAVVILALALAKEDEGCSMEKVIEEEILPLPI
eukprot:gene4890-3507_t